MGACLRWSSCLILCVSSESGGYADQDSGPDRGHDRAGVQPTVAADDHLRHRVQPARLARALGQGQLAAHGALLR